MLCTTPAVDMLLGLLALLCGPSLAVGLKSYPRAGAALVGLWRVLARVAFTVHKDAPGTFKLPGAASPEPKGESE